MTYNNYLKNTYNTHTEGAYNLMVYMYICSYFFYFFQHLDLYIKKCVHLKNCHKNTIKTYSLLNYNTLY